MTFHLSSVPPVDQALSYAARGWPVLSLKPGAKTPSTHNGFKDATTDRGEVKKWWSQNPNFGVGIATGGRTGLFVLDVDNKGGIDGNQSLTQLIERHGGEWPETLLVETPSGGLHYYLRGPASIRNSAGALGPGLDIRGTGGYVCAPPTVIGGKSYIWRNDHEPADAPHWLIDLLLGPRIAQGARNDTLFRIGCSHRGKGASVAEIESKLRDVPIEGELDPGEYERIAASAGRYEPGAYAGAHDPCTHVANAHRLVKHFRSCILYVEGIGWHRWGPPWQFDELGVRRIVQSLGKIIADEVPQLATWAADAADAGERERREKVVKARFAWASKSESATNIEASLKLAAPHLSVKAEELDAKELLFGLPGGVLELDNCNQREHRQSDLITKVAGCDHDPNADAPTWCRFVREIFCGDDALIDYVQTLCGYALLGARADHILPIAHGGGANGKSTFLGTLQQVFGDYAGTAAPGLLIKHNGNEHPTALADLHGKRLVVCSETGEAGRLNEELVKALTGGDRISARRMREDFWTFKPSHILFLQTNHRPRVAGTDEGIWRRLRLIPFNVTIPPGRRDSQLPVKLRQELPGILNWCLKGLDTYKAYGFREPEAVLTATTEYRESSDVVGAFLTECCEIDSSGTETAASLYRAYVFWCESNGERTRSQKDFGMRLSERGFTRIRSASDRRWQGLKIVNRDPSDPSFGITPINEDST